MKGRFLLRIKNGTLVSDALSVVLVKIIGAVATILLSILITRLVGKAAFGLVSIANQIMNFALLIALMGHNQIAPREFSKIRGDAKAVTRNILLLRKYIFHRSALICLTLMVLSYPIFSYGLDSPHFTWFFILLLLGFIPQTISKTYSAISLGLKKVWQSNFIHQTLTSLLILLFIVLSKYFFIKIELINVVVCYVFARIIVYFTFNIFFTIGLGLKIGFFETTEDTIINQNGYTSKSSRRNFLFIALTSFAYNSLNSIILGATAGPVEAGVYNIILKIVTPITFVLVALQLSSVPRIAKRYAYGDIKFLKKSFVKVGILAGSVGIFFFTAMFFFGDQILQIWRIFDVEIHYALVVMAFGFFIDSITSNAGPILAMTGNEHIHSRINGGSVMLQLILGILLSLSYGIIGAAVSFTVVMLISNLLKVYFMITKVFRAT